MGLEREEQVVEQERAEKQLHDVIKEEDKQVDLPSEVRVHEDETRENRTPGFARMRIDWASPEAAHISVLRDTVEEAILRSFPDAVSMMLEIHLRVRTPKRTDGGDIMVDAQGWPLWEKTPSGAYIEDYSRLGVKEREHFLFQITTHLYEWKQRSGDLWGEAMIAKAVWEERFSNGFLSTPGSRPTVDDKTNHARANAVDERYFAIYRTWISRRADSLTSSMELIGQRLKDTLVS